MPSKESDIIRDLKLLCRDQLVSLVSYFFCHSNYRSTEHCTRCFPCTCQSLGFSFAPSTSIGNIISDISRFVHYRMCNRSINQSLTPAMAQNPNSILADLASMLLSNLTSSSAACSTLLSVHISIVVAPGLPNGFYPSQSRCSTSPAPEPYPAGEQRDVLALPLLLDAFTHGAQADESGDLSKRTRKGDLHFLASVFANLTIVRKNIVAMK